MILAVVGYVIYLIGFKYGAFEKLGIIKPVAQAIYQNVTNGSTVVPGGTLT